MSAAVAVASIAPVSAITAASMAAVPIPIPTLDCESTPANQCTRSRIWDSGVRCEATPAPSSAASSAAPSSAASFASACQAVAATVTASPCTSAMLAVANALANAAQAQQAAAAASTITISAKQLPPSPVTPDCVRPASAFAFSPSSASEEDQELMAASALYALAHAATLVEAGLAPPRPASCSFSSSSTSSAFCRPFSSRADSGMALSRAASSLSTCSSSSSSSSSSVSMHSSGFRSISAVEESASRKHQSSSSSSSQQPAKRRRHVQNHAAMLLACANENATLDERLAQVEVYDEFLAQITLEALRCSRTYLAASTEERAQLISRRSRVLDRIRKRAVRRVKQQDHTDDMSSQDC